MENLKDKTNKFDQSIEAPHSDSLPMIGDLSPNLSQNNSVIKIEESSRKNTSDLEIPSFQFDSKVPRKIYDFLE